jgi:hypothetical protein
MAYDGYNVDDLQKIILFELGQTTGTTVSYGKYPEWLIRQKLTERQNQFVFRSRCLRRFALIPAKDGYRQYRLPLNCMPNGVIAAKYYDSTTSYVDLNIRDMAFMDSERPGWDTADDGTPEDVIMGDSYGNIPTIYVYPPCDTTGTDYASSPDTGIYVGTTMPGASNNYTGTATGGDATSLLDTVVDFTKMGLVAGMCVRNQTDGCIGQITTIAAHDITVTTLSGGTLNVFTAADLYEILAGEYAVVTSYGNKDRYIFGTYFGMLNNITIPADTIKIDYVPYPIPFSFTIGGTDGALLADTQRPDIPKLWHSALADGVVADFLKMFSEASKEFQRAQAYEAKFAQAVLDAQGKRGDSPFENTPVQMVPSRRR